MMAFAQKSCCGCAALQRLPELLRRRRPELDAPRPAKEAAAPRRSASGGLRRSATDVVRSGHREEHGHGRLGRSHTAAVHGRRDGVYDDMQRRGSTGSRNGLRGSPGSRGGFDDRRREAGDGRWESSSHAISDFRGSRRGRHSRGEDGARDDRDAGARDAGGRDAGGRDAECRGMGGRPSHGGRVSRSSSGVHEERGSQSGSHGGRREPTDGRDHRYRGERLSRSNSHHSSHSRGADAPPREHGRAARGQRAGREEQPTLLTSKRDIGEEKVCHRARDAAWPDDGDAGLPQWHRHDQPQPQQQLASTNTATCGTEAVEVVSRALNSATELVNWDAVLQGTKEISSAALDVASAGARRTGEALQAAVSDLWHRTLETVREEDEAEAEAAQASARGALEQPRDLTSSIDDEPPVPDVAMLPGSHDGAVRRAAPFALGGLPPRQTSFGSVQGYRAPTLLASPGPGPHKLVHAQSWSAGAGFAVQRRDPRLMSSASFASSGAKASAAPPPLPSPVTSTTGSFVKTLPSPVGSAASLAPPAIDPAQFAPPSPTGSARAAALHEVAEACRAADAEPFFQW